MPILARRLSQGTSTASSSCPGPERPARQPRCRRGGSSGHDLCRWIRDGQPDGLERARQFRQYERRGRRGFGGQPRRASADQQHHRHLSHQRSAEWRAALSGASSTSTPIRSQWRAATHTISSPAMPAPQPLSCACSCNLAAAATSCALCSWITAPYGQPAHGPPSPMLPTISSSTGWRRPPPARRTAA